MQIIVEGTAKEIAALVLALQERQEFAMDDASIFKAVMRHRESQGPDQQAYEL